MKIKTVKLHNFRSYKDVAINFDDLTAFVGKNDIGKSTILEALDIFFNESKGVVKFDESDRNIEAKGNGDSSLSITVEFCDLPEEVVLDSTAKTSFQQEYMLNKSGNLEIIKYYPNNTKCEMRILAMQPTMPGGEKLINLTNRDLKALAKAQNIECENTSSNPCLRHAIWDALGNTDNMQEVEIELNSTDGKKIAETLQKLLPSYAMFQSDRSNSESDKEIQDPLKSSVKRLMKGDGIQEQLDEIAKHARKCLEEVANNTIAKLKELDPSLADSLKPVIPDTSQLKWEDVFKNVSIAGADNIPLNKRGSGVRRMILLSFFRAEAERVSNEKGDRGIIYAIEEPETSQHGENQKLLIDAFKSLSGIGSQIIITTHSSQVVKRLQFENVRLITDENGDRAVVKVEKDLLPIPSLNEVNFLAFGDISEEYHIELYSHIFSMNWVKEMEKGLTMYTYIQQDSKDKNKTTERHISLPEKLRHMMHHRENTHNGMYSKDELKQSIEIMRAFLLAKKAEND